MMVEDWLRQESAKRAEKFVKELLDLSEENIQKLKANHNKKDYLNCKKYTQEEIENILTNELQ